MKENVKSGMGLYLRVRFSRVCWRDIRRGAMSSSMSEMSDWSQKAVLIELPRQAACRDDEPKLFQIYPPHLWATLTLQLWAAALAQLVPAVSGAVVHLRDGDQELAVVSEDRHGQLAPALLHQVLGLQEGKVLRRHAVDLFQHGLIESSD